jgi:hypothetical protein
MKQGPGPRGRNREFVPKDTRPGAICHANSGVAFPPPPWKWLFLIFLNLSA